MTDTNTGPGVEKHAHVVIGAGPLGMATARALAAAGQTVRILSRSGRAPDAVGTSVVACDVHDRTALVRALRDTAVVYQCAQPAYTRWRNEFVPLQRAVLTAAREAGARAVIADNLYAYGLVHGTMTEETPVRPNSTKGAIRARMAEEALAMHARGELQVTIARGSDFFGPRVRGSVLGERVWGPLAEGRAANATGDPDLPHTYTYVDDFGRALSVLGLGARGIGEVWHVPNAPTLTTRALLQHAASVLGHEVVVKAAGRRMMRLAGFFIPEARETVEMMYEFEKPFIVSSEKFTTTFGLEATPTADAVSATMQWYLSQRKSGTTR